jgi:hypothetical protein
LNINGNDGPTLKKVFTCEDCKWLSKASFNGFICLHSDLVLNKTSFQLMLGSINNDKITPKNCPYLKQKERVEKLKQLYEYRRNDKTST